MRRTRILATLLALAPFSAGRWAVGQQGSPPPNRPAEPPREVYTPPKPDAKGTERLREALSCLDPERHPWIETRLWQQGEVQGLAMQAEGMYRTGPDRRMRLELSVRLPDASGRLVTVSDGVNWWHSLQFGRDTRPEVYRADLAKVREAMQAPGVPAEARTGFLRAHALAGLAPFLQTVGERMTVSNQEPTQWNGRRVVKLTAFWTEQVGAAVLRANPSWPILMPRKCYLYLEAGEDALKGWPHRVEWWGPTPSAAEDRLCLEMEFRDPKVDQALSAERQEREFRFDPGGLKVVDVSDQLTAMFRGRIGQPLPKPGG
jgi:hypothetical protein